MNTASHCMKYTFTLITWIFNVYSCEVTTSFYLHLPALQRFGPLAAVLRGCDGTTFPLLWGRSVWIDLPLGYSATDIYLDPSPGGDAQKTFQSTRLYATLPGHSGLMLFRSGDWVLNLYEFVWFVNEKKVMWNVLRFWWRLDFVRFGFVLPLCLGWIASQLWIVQDFSGESCWAPRFIIDLSISMQLGGFTDLTPLWELWVLLQSWSSKIHITQALAYGYHVLHIYIIANHRRLPLARPKKTRFSAPDRRKWHTTPPR